MNRTSGIASLKSILMMLLTITALCGGATTARAATAYIVSGMVTAPGGVIAFHDQADDMSLAHVLNFFIAPAEAKLSGLLPVPNGTPVELVRVTDTGRMSAPIATATTRYGRYQFNLTTLRRSVSSRLLVRVDNVATGAQMRAFVSDRTVDINPVSEATVRVVLEAVAASPDVTLDNFTVTELEDLNGALDLLSSANDLQAGADIAASVQDIRDAVAGNAGIRAFLTASARPGQTRAGPGDIGNFFPFTKGLSWTYKVQNTENGIASAPYTNTVLINGTRLIKGVITTVFRNSNSDGDGVVDNDFNRKTSSGVYDWEVVRDGDSNKPHQFVRFPAAPGSSFTQTLNDMGLNQDLDRDGIVERFTFTATTTVISLGTVPVPAGALPKTLKIRTVMSGGATVSSTQKRVSVTVTAFEWYTQNLGLSKQLIIYRASYDGRVWKDTSTSELTEASGFPFTGEFPLDRWQSIDIESNDMVYDHISGKLFASVGSEATAYANSVVVIDPDTAAIETTIPVGPDPWQLAISDDGQFLYVGLCGEQGSIRQVSIPTLTAGPEWVLANDPVYEFPLYARDIAVQPGNPEVLAVITVPYPFNTYYHWSTLIMDKGLQRPQISTFRGPESLMFSEEPSIAYAWFLDVEVLYAVSADGISEVERRRSQAPGNIESFDYANGRIYTNTGGVSDPASGALLGTLSVMTNAYWVTADATNDRIIFAINDASRLQVFSASTWNLLDEISIADKEYNYSSARQLVVAGPNIFATRPWKTYLSRSHVILIKAATTP